MQKANKLLALFLCLVMLVSSLPVQAFATGEEPTEGVEVTEPETGYTEAADASEASSVPEEPSEEATEASEGETVPTEEEAEEDTLHTLAEDDVVSVTDGEGVVTGYKSLAEAMVGVFGGGNYTYAGNYVVTLLGNTSGANQNIQYPTDGVNVNLTIDLNGHTIQGTGSGAVLVINFGNKTPGTLTIQDSVGGGTITGGKQGVQFSGYNSTLNFNGGTITNNHGAEKGGGILCTSNTAVVNLNGGTITGNSVSGNSSANTGLGGGVCGYNINVNGTVITGNVATGGSGVYTGRGGGIATQITGTGTAVHINTNTVYGNTAANAGDDLMIAKNSNSSHTLTIGTENWYVDGWNGSDHTKGETARYSAEAPVPYTDGGVSAKKFALGLKYAVSTVNYTVTYTDGVEDEVVFEDQTYTVKENAETPAFEGTIVRKGYAFDGWTPEVAESVTADVTYTATWKVCEHQWKPGAYNAETGMAESVCEVCGETKSAEVVAMVKGTGMYYETLQDAINAGTADIVVILKDLDIGTVISVKHMVTVTADKDVTLTRTGTNDVFDVYADAMLTLEGPVTLVGSTKYGTMVDVLKGGTFIMNEGVTIKDNVMGKSGTAGGVTVTDGSFIMNGGSIENCGNTGSTKPGSSNGGTLGGGVRVVASSASTTPASFVMNGGSITGCSAYIGGGIGLENKGAKVAATVIINGGTISGCSASGNSANYRGGSAIYIYNKTGNVDDATVTMYAGNITGNTAKYNGALCTYTGTTGNTYGGKFYILGGTISGNVSGSGDPSSFYGNGIYVDRLIGGKSLLAVGGSAVIADDVYLKNSTGNYFEVMNGFTGSVNVYVAAGGTGSNAESYYGTLVAKQVSSNATKDIAKGIVAVYGFKNSEGRVYEHPKYDVVPSNSAADSYVLGEPASSYTVTYTDGVADEVVFEDETYTVDADEATPAFQGTHVRKGYVFDGWDPEVADTVTADVTYTATWKVCEHQWDEGTFDEKTMSWVYTCDICGETKSVAAVARLESTGDYYATLQEAVTAADAYSKTLSEDHDQTVTLVADTTECVKISYVPTNKNLYDYTLTINLNGHTVTGAGTGSVFSISRSTSWNAKLTVVFNDSVGTGKVTGGKATGNGGAIYVSGKSSYLVINGGTWTGNHTDKNGGVVSSSLQEPTYVTVNGGVFTGNSATGNGGAFYVRSLTMTGGTITGNTAASGGGVYAFSGYTQVLDVTGGAIYGNTATNDGDDIIWRANRGTSTTSYLTLPNAGSMGATGITGWFVDAADNRYDAENPVEFTDYAKYTTLNTRIALKAAMESAPEAPARDGSNVMPNLVTTICDSDPDHGSVFSDWSSVNCQVYPTSSVPVWDAELGAWTIGIRIQSLTVQYVAKLERANNKIHHDLVGESLLLATLKWDKAQSLWVTMDGKPLEVHATCKTKPSAPEFKQISSYQVHVYGPVNFESKMYAVSLNQSTVTVGEVQGNRKDGFTVDVTVAITEDDAYQTKWVAQRASGNTVSDYIYDWTKTPATITFTLKYTGDLNGTLYGNRHASNTNYDWVLSTTGKHFGKIGEAYLLPTEPDAPKASNVTENLLTVICDSDPDRHHSVSCKWYDHCCKAVSGVVWSDELNAWTVDVKIGSLYVMYVDTLEDANNGVTHELVDGANSINTTLKWDAAAKQWVPAEAIELHTTCRTAPLAPVYRQVDAYQIKVKGDVDGDGVYGESAASSGGVGEVYTTSIPEGGYTLSEVYGSREEGFFVDVTVTLEEGDLYQSRWINKCDSKHSYTYDWSKTEKTVTFTLKYNGSLTGTLYGNRHASNTNYDWVLSTTGKTFGVVSDAFVEKVMCNVQVVIYRNGEKNVPYKQIMLAKVAKGDTLKFSDLDINDYYSSTYGFEFEGWYNDGAWNQYKSNGSAAPVDEIVVNGWTNVICMVTDNQRMVVKYVFNGDKDTAENLFVGVAPKGANVIEWLNANVTVPEKEGYTADFWYNWDWYGHKVGATSTVNGWTNVYVNYVANTYTVTFDTNGGADVDPRTVTYGAKYGTLPSASVNGLSSRKNDWYLVAEDGTVTEINIRNSTVVSVARDHTLFLKRDVLAPNVSIKLTVPGALSDDYKYYVPGNSTRVLTATVNNRNDEILDYTYQWYKGDVLLEGETSAVLTLAGNVSDTGKYKVVVTATLKADSTIVVGVSSASGEKTQDVKIMYAANTLRLNDNYGETPATSDSYWGADSGIIRGTASRKGYTFQGWNTAPDGTGTMYQSGDSVDFPGANGNGGIVLELYAQWKANTYTVTLDANGGSFVMPLDGESEPVTKVTITVTYGQPVGEMPIPEWEGHTFAGWFDSEGKQVTAETVYEVEGDITLTASWTANQYNVKLNANGGKLEDDTVKATYGEPMGELPVPSRDGYIFCGWYDGNGKKVTPETVYDWTEDIELKAIWVERKEVDPTLPGTGDGTTLFFMGTLLTSACALLFLASRKRKARA